VVRKKVPLCKPPNRTATSGAEAIIENEKSNRQHPSDSKALNGNHEITAISDAFQGSLRDKLGYGIMRNPKTHKTCIHKRCSICIAGSGDM
jgi:hypothetical protein